MWLAPGRQQERSVEADLAKCEINLENQVGTRRRVCLRGSARRTLRAPSSLRGVWTCACAGTHRRAFVRFLQKHSTTMTRWRARSSLITKSKTLNPKPFSKDMVVPECVGDLHDKRVQSSDFLT